MGIESLLAQTCTQTAVYWGAPEDDGYGGKNFDSIYPVEIACRWKEKTELIVRVGARLSEELISNAQVFVTQDVDEKGYLYLGTLDDLDSGEEENPETVDGAYIIKKFEKIPALRSTTEFVRKAYL